MKKLPNELIPSFDELYQGTCEFVKAHQGEKGYIDVQNFGTMKDSISAMIWDDEMGHGLEMEVHGVRYDEQYDSLDILAEPIMRTVRIQYDDESFRSEDADWMSIKGDYVYYYYTLIEIAQYIHEYVD